jgi:long-chain acyl-CoA synthetase
MDEPNPYASRPWLAAYAPGVPESIDDVTQTLSDMIEASIARHGRATALEFFGATTTYADLGEQIDRAAEGLRRLGVTPGDRVAIILPNCPQHVVAFYAVLRLGGIVVEHNPLYTARELRHQFEDHQARFAIAWDKVYDTLDGFPSDLKLERIVSVDITEAMPWTTRLALRLPVAKARDARAQLTGGIRAPLSTTSPCCSTRAARPARRRVRSSRTATCGRTRCRVAPGCRGCTRARRPSTASFLSSTRTA